MQANFWHERWQKNQIGFHQNTINPYLISYWPSLAISTATTVFVPLCGKSLDMLWLRAQGYQVLGVELSQLAVRDFFQEHKLSPAISQHGAFERWEVDGLVLLVGDFFDLKPADLADCTAIYDRASLIALPPAMRPRYVEHFLTLRPSNAPVLLITLNYDQSIAGGPPFAVSPAEVQQYYAPQFTISPVKTVSVLHEFPKFQQQGVPIMDEHVFIMQPKTTAS